MISHFYFKILMVRLISQMIVFYFGKLLTVVLKIISNFSITFFTYWSFMLACIKAFNDL